MNIWSGFSKAGLSINEKNVVFKNVVQAPFVVCGFNNPKVNFHRMPDEDALSVSEAVASHNLKAAGGRIRFATDSPYVAIRVKHANYNLGAPHISKLASVGMDLYATKDGTERFFGSYYPPLDCECEYEGIKYLGEKAMREITICMPYDKEIYSVEVGIAAGAEISKHSEYKYKKPVVFYGSSITHGYCASRPGNIYENFISRELDCDFLNLGFAGSAMGEIKMAKYIAGLSMSAFVFDYDYNAPDVAHLAKTHELFIRTVRQKNPNLPIVMVTRPDSILDVESQSRKDIIMNSYLNFRKNGDKNVYYIDGYTLFPNECCSDCTVDGCHPNDLGHYYMAKRISSVLERIIK